MVDGDGGWSGNISRIQCRIMPYRWWWRRGAPLKIGTGAGGGRRWWWCCRCNRTKWTYNSGLGGGAGATISSGDTSIFNDVTMLMVVVEVVDNQSHGY